jgi:hypothetical protein
MSRTKCAKAEGAIDLFVSRSPVSQGLMTVVAIICAVCVLIGLPVLVTNRDIIRRKLRRRRHRRTAALPFLFFPTADRSKAPPPPPAWNGKSVAQAEPRVPLQPEPGIADLPPSPDAEIADLPPDYRARRAADRKLPVDLAGGERLEARRGSAR